MIADISQYLLVTLAIGCGWLIGRLQSSSVPADRDTAVPASYFKGLNYLLNEQPDGAIEAFIEALDVNSETLETHLALGNLLRRRGEVDRAIRIHQNLLARPTLPESQQHLAELELAKDFQAAGLMDRAERLLNGLVDKSPELRLESLKLLMALYQEQGEWQLAIDATLAQDGRLITLRRSNLSIVLAHFSCELAQEALQSKKPQEAEQFIRKALKYDKQCGRAFLLQAQLEYEQGEAEAAIKSLSTLIDLTPDAAEQVLALLGDCYRLSGDLEAYHQHLKGLVESGLIGICEPFLEMLRSEQGDAAAIEYLLQQIDNQPSIKWLRRWLDWLIEDSEDAEVVQLAQQLTLVLAQLEPFEPSRFVCGHCGFSARQHHWQCPSCKRWGSVEMRKKS